MPLALLALLGIGGLALLASKEQKPKKLAASGPNGSATNELAAELQSLLASEDNPEILEFAAKTFEKLGYLDDAKRLRDKAASIEAAKSAAATTTPVTDDTGAPVSWQSLTTAKDLAEWLILDTENKGCWRWDVGAVKKFQQVTKIRVDGIFGPETLGALAFFEPDGYHLFVNCGVLQVKSKQAPSGAAVDTDITAEDIQALLISPDYAAGYEKARQAHEASN